MRVISWLAEELLTAEEEHRCTQLVAGYYVICRC